MAPAQRDLPSMKMKSKRSSALSALANARALVSTRNSTVAGSMPAEARFASTASRWPGK
jgi:hypothetical protein